jgi:folate-dependent phosphoribosylglycinamide formyltransferase PurN
MPGIVMLVGNDPASRMVYHALAETFPIDAVIREEKVPTTTLLKRRAKKLGWRKVAGQILFAKAVLPVVRYQSRRRLQEIIASHGLNSSEMPGHLVVDVPSVNSDVTIAELQRRQARVIVVNGTRIIQEKVLNCTDAIFLNTHVGITPMYRGVHGGYWALACQDAGNCGVTVHRVDRGIDTGSIVAQAVIRPTADDTFCTYPLLQLASAIPLLRTAIQDALNGQVGGIPPPKHGASKLWTHPTAWEYLKYRIALGVQ